MPLDKRSMFILDKLVNTKEYVYPSYLMQELNVSKRTVYYDLEKINSWLDDHQLESVKRSYSKGFYLSGETKQKAGYFIQQTEQNQYFYTKDERISLLAIQLILGKGSVYLQDLMDKTDVSRVTTFQDLNILKKEFASFELAIKFNRSDGYYVIGNENNKRKTLAHYLTYLFSKQGWDRFSKQVLSNLNPETPVSSKQGLQSSKDLSRVKEISDYYTFISRCEKNLDIELTDEMLHNLALHLFIICNRVEQGIPVHIDPHEKSVLRSTSEFVEAQRLTDQIEKWCGIQFPKDEVCYLTILFLGAKVYTLNPEYRQNQEMKELQRTMKNMIFDFQKYACVFFQDQHELENLMFIHLKPAYYRIKYDVFTENPLTEKIKTQYHEVFEITKKVIYHLENLLGKSINEQETAYISMYFGGWMRRQGASAVARRKALIICENGLGTSNLLRIQLEQLLSAVDIVDTISLRDYDQNQYEVDLFFSTVEIREKEKPVIHVNPILNDEDKKNLLFQLNAIDGHDPNFEPMLSSLLDVIQKHAEIFNEEKLIQDLKSFLNPNRLMLKETEKPMLHELLTEDMIQFKSAADDWEDAIRMAANPLLEQGYITEHYIEAMIKNVKQLGPYIVIVPNIAIPHARPEHGVKKLGMSLLHLEKAVDFSSEADHSAQLVIVLAAVDNEAHLRALSQLTTLLSDKEKVEKITLASSPEEITTLLHDLPIDNNENIRKEGEKQ